ncbi:MAG: DNA polymerase III subunit gamma/tau [Candidatus Gastranaerophilaceae bacterium]
MNEKHTFIQKITPEKLEEVVGRDILKALKMLLNLIKFHVFIYGTKRSGKTSTARIFAKSLNCKEGPTISPCGVCENCIDITNSTPMDVIEIDAASNRKVEDAQNILEKVMYAPVNSRYKIYIIDEVHMLSTTAFNALLKTLEEPPKNVIFILATTEVHKVLDTIKSRCQRFDFKRITTDDIVKHLRYISDCEKINITDDALFTIAKNSAGGMRDSIALLDQLSVLDGKEAISTDDINNLLGRLSFDTLNSLADKIVNSKPQEAIEELEKIYNSGNEPVQILTNLMDYLKNLLIVKNCRAEIAFELTQANDAQVSALKAQTEILETHQIVFLIEKCAEYIKELKLTNNPRLWLEVAIIDLANLTENTSLVELQNRIARLEGGAAAPVKVAAYKTAPAPVLKPEIKQPPKVEPVKPVIEETDKTVEIKSEPVKAAELILIRTILRQCLNLNPW